MALSAGIFAFLSLLSATVSFALGIFVFAKNPKNTVHKMFLLVCIFASYWAFTEYMIRISESPESAFIWLNLGALWIFAPVIVLHFTLLFTDSSIIQYRRRYLTYAAMYVPAMIFSVLELTTELIVSGVRPTYWGYAYSIPGNPALYVTESFWAILMIMLSLIVCLRHFFRTDGRKRKQTEYIMVGLAFPFIAGLWSMAFTPGMSDLITISILFYSYFVASAMWKYRLFEVTPESIADEIIGTMNDSLILLDSEGRIITVNNSACRLLEYEKDQLVGMPFHSLLEDREESDVIYTKTQESGSFSDLETTFFLSNGYSFPVNCSCSAIRGPDGMFAGIVLIARDITRQKMAESAIKQANEKLKLLNTITRHDMLNQLTALKGYLLLSLQSVTEEPEKKYIENCVITSDRLFEQVEFTRDYQDIGIKSPEWMDAGLVVSSVAENFAGEKPVIASDIRDVEIYADLLFERVIFNLIDNSIRHGETVSRISFSAHETESGLEIVCKDNGVGIAVDEKPRVFDKGFGKNTGLGLFLSREILSITDITISETGEPGDGAMFVMHVPPGKYRITSID